MDKNLMTAVRTYVRLETEASNRRALAADADAGFDGGEWSRSWHAARWVEEEEARMRTIAERFGLTYEQLDTAIFRYINEQSDHYFYQHSRAAHSSYELN